MKRRDFFAASAAVAAWPALKAFACPPLQPGVDVPCADPIAGVDDVSAAYRQAVQVGKPLLVILVPTDGGPKWERGQLWGELLNHASLWTWSTLGCVEVVWATAAALAAVAPAARVTDDTLFVLVETDALPARATAHTAVIPEYADAYRRGGDPAMRDKSEREIGDLRIRVLGALIDEAVFGPSPDKDRDAGLERRAVQARAARAARPSTSDDDNACLLLLSPHRKDGVDRVAAAARARLQDQRVRGSKWATSSGCGVAIEGEKDDVGVLCGMGHTPALARRFLYWFSKDE